MGRLIRISIYALVILILYFWITAILKSYEKDAKNVDQVESIVDTLGETTMESDTSIVDEDMDYEVLSNEEIVDGKVNYKALDEKVKALEKNETPKLPKDATSKNVPLKSNEPAKPSIKQAPSIKNQETNVEPANKSIHGDGGPYWVMAGSYLLKDNALKMVNKLKKMGFANAEVVVFQSSQFHSVVAAKFSTESKAKTSVSELKRRGVDSFVKSI